MIVELINTGSELMLGRVLNTHQQWLCRQLADLGYVVTRQVAVPDTGSDIEQAVREALGRADLVIATGGLGPTSDDLTRDLVAQLLGKALREDAAVLAHIRGFFESRKRYMPERIKVQALVPEGAMVLHNPHGTAPGLAMEVAAQPVSRGRPGELAHHAARSAARVAADVHGHGRAAAAAGVAAGERVCVPHVEDDGHWRVGGRGEDRRPDEALG